MTATAPSLSVVIPVHNEEDNVEPLHADLQRALDTAGESVEVLFVNDGSTDGTMDRLRALRASDATVRIIDLDGNYGEAAALSAGFHGACGEAIITIDGDGQNDPADIPKLLRVLRSGNLAAVSGRRTDRKEDLWLRLLPSRTANTLIAWVTGLPVHDCGCGLKAYRYDAVARIHLPRGMNRFLPAILGVRPGEVAEVPIRDRHRQHGSSHYGLARTFAVLRDLLAIRFLIAAPRRSEIGFALATTGCAGLGALLVGYSVPFTALCDIIAVICGAIWWNVRRFNRAQTEGVYRIRGELPPGAAVAGADPTQRQNG